MASSRRLVCYPRSHNIAKGDTLAHGPKLKAAIEIDYAALHVRLLYQEAGKHMVGDPYEIEGWPRKKVKLALLIGINARTQRSAIRALAGALASFPGIHNRFETAKALLDAVRAKHSDIAHAFGSDAGARLMRRNADLAERVKIEMLDATGIVPLSVHDSFIVPATQAGRLKEAMERHVSGKKTPNFATTHPPEIPKETSKVVPQYGTRTGRDTRDGTERWVGRCLGWGDGWDRWDEDECGDLLGTLLQWRRALAVKSARR